MKNKKPIYKVGLYCQECDRFIRIDEPTPACPDFKPHGLTPWLCAWWDWEDVDGVREWFCSRPAWDYRECETKGMRGIKCHL